jgi:hypothetical protein
MVAGNPNILYKLAVLRACQGMTVSYVCTHHSFACKPLLSQASQQNKDQVLPSPLVSLGAQLVRQSAHEPMQQQTRMLQLPSSMG